jgi:hypothetical protein
MGEKLMTEFNDDIVKNRMVFDGVVRKIWTSGVEDEEEIVEILQRDHHYLFRELTEAEEKAAVEDSMDSLVNESIADLNRESIKEKGHPFVVCQWIDGVKYAKRYDALTVQEVGELRESGVIL